jgi:microsomal dipeptidase-like Zn-dependent dipeptidase
MAKRASAVTRRNFLGTSAGALAVSSLEAARPRWAGAAPATPGQIVVDMAVHSIAPRVPAADLTRTLEAARQGSLGVAVATVLENEDWESGLERIEGITPLLERFNLAHCRTVEEIGQAYQAGRTAVVLRTSGAYWMVSPHGGYPMITLFKPGRFGALRRLGVRVVQLTDDFKGLLGDGCAERTDCGLTDYGLWAVRTMNEEGLLIDCSHAGYRTSMEAIEVSRDPVVFSSSNVHGLAPHNRNLRDDQIEAVAAKGGAVGVSAEHLLVDAAGASLARLLDHVDHIARLVGDGHVMLGLGLGVPGPHAVKDHAELPALRAGLRARGYADDTIGKMLGGNALRIFQAVWKRQEPAR